MKERQAASAITLRSQTMHEPDLDHLKNLRTSLLEILEESTGHLKYLDKVDARSWKLHVVDPLYDVAKFVGNRVVDRENR